LKRKGGSIAVTDVGKFDERYTGETGDWGFFNSVWMETAVRVIVGVHA
jgi:hypothetical protein